MLLPIEKYCLEQCMANNARLQQLGLPPYNPNGTITPANSKDKNKTKQRYRKDPDYGPLQDDTGEQDDAGEQDSFDDEIAKVIILPSCQGLFFCLFGNAIQLYGNIIDSSWLPFVQGL